MPYLEEKLFTNMYKNEGNNSISSGFGITPERVNELTEFMHGSEKENATVGDVLSFICNSDVLSQDEIQFLLFDYGIRLGKNLMADTYRSILQNLGAVAPAPENAE